MSHARAEPSQNASNRIFALPEKPGDAFIILVRLGVLFCLFASIWLALHSAFLKPTRSMPFQDHTRDAVNLSPSAVDTGPTNISHILFGIGGSVKTWRDRCRYSELWWDPKATRGFVWLDEEPGKHVSDSVPYRVSEIDWARLKYFSSIPAVRIARILYESFKLGLPDVRWFVLGDDDTVFFTENLVTVLSKYDHNEMHYIGANSESVEQNVAHGYSMAYGGGGIAVSYPLAARLAKIYDSCLYRYYYFYGSDQRIWACVSELGIPLTIERGFHQFDIRGDPFGLLAAHPLTPLVSLHHLDYLEPIFPDQNQLESLNFLMRAYRVDPARTLQQTFCYDRLRRLSVSVSWGYTVQVFTTWVTARDLQVPFQTFTTWGTWSPGPFLFNTIPMSPDPCHQPAIYFLDRVEDVGVGGSLTTYKRANNCPSETVAVQFDTITVSATRLDSEYWKKVPQRQCCEVVNRSSRENTTVHIRVRKCGPLETISI